MTRRTISIPSWLAAAIVAAAGAMLCASCGIRQPEDYDPDIEIVFDPVMYTTTKSSKTADGQYPQDVDFGVSMWDYPAGEGLSKASPYMQDVRVTRARDTRSDESTGVWKPVSGALWPSKRNNCAVIAYAPYGRAAGVSLASGVVFEDVDTASDQTDLLYTDCKSDLTKLRGATIDLPFRHALCLVDIAIRCNAQASEKVTIDRVALANACTRGDFKSGPWPVWTVYGPESRIVFLDEERQVTLANTPMGGSLWMVPQDLTTTIDASVHYTDSKGITTDVDLSCEAFEKTFEPGRHYTITLSLTLDTMTLALDNVSTTDVEDADNDDN